MFFTNINRLNETNKYCTKVKILTEFDFRVKRTYFFGKLGNVRNGIN